MKKLWILVVLVLIVSTAQANMVIQSINASDVITSFDVIGGDYGLGVLSIDDDIEVVVEDTGGGQTTYTNGHCAITSSLQADTSLGGIASGVFMGGSLAFNDGYGNALLTGDIVSIEVVENFDGFGMLSGMGGFIVTGGSLETSFGLPLGEIVQITFKVTPATIADFSQAFSASSNITVMPIPEPATLALLGIGGLVFLRSRKHQG